MFDYSCHMKDLIEDISYQCGAFDHIDSSRILVGITRSRNNKRDGLQAKLVPMKFKGGMQTMQAGKGDCYEMPKLRNGGKEILYVIYFCLPRFQNLDFDTKMMIIFFPPLCA